MCSAATPRIPTLKCTPKYFIHNVLIIWLVSRVLDQNDLAVFKPLIYASYYDKYWKVFFKKSIIIVREKYIQKYQFMNCQYVIFEYLNWIWHFLKLSAFLPKRRDGEPNFQQYLCSFGPVGSVCTVCNNIHSSGK